MGLAARVIPTFLVKGHMLVKGKKFAGDRVVGHAYQAIMVQAARGVDEVCLLDISATAEGRGPDLKLIEQLADGLFAPLSVGGGIRSVKDMRDVLRAGADKVVIGTGAAEVPDLVRECADIAGCQAVVVSVDVGFSNSVMIRSGKTGYSHDPIYYAQWAERAGAGEILLQSIDRDGTLDGYDLDLVRSVACRVGVPVIASGGCKGYDDMLLAVMGGASGVAAGALFQFTDATPKGASGYLYRRGIEARV
jgi:cyclase